jgi:hypothetical protein
MGGKTRRRGQALVMVTLALFAMLGLMGLLVDFGWAFFVEKMSQNAADAAALAAVRAALQAAGSLAGTSCMGGTVVCAPTPISCASATGNLAAGCQYALRNGFDWTQPDITVTVQASDRVTPPTVTGCNPVTHHPPTAPCVDTYYWVTVRVARQVPQLFSAIRGNRTGLVSSRATAAIAQSTTVGSLIILNRDNDTWIGATGTVLDNTGNAVLRAPGGITIASGDPIDAGYLQGDSHAIAAFTWIRAGGNVRLQGNATWTAAPVNQNTNSSIPPDTNPYNSPFVDPFYGSGQPPLDQTALAALPGIAVPNGDLTTAICPNGICPPGVYYATEIPKQCKTNCVPQPSGGPIKIWQGNFQFQASNFNSGNFVFFGGLSIGQAQVQFSPGRYVLAGVNPSYTQYVFETTNQSQITGGSVSPASHDAGRIFILTDEQYASDQLAAARAKVTGQLPDLVFGKAKLIAGSSASSSITLQGLNRGSTELPLELHAFSPVLFWQDQRNSNYRYNPDGTYGCADFNAACPQSTSDGRGDPNPEFWMQATQYLNIWGATYQPRGAWMQLQGGNLQTGPIQIVTGAVRLQGGSDLTLTGLEQPIVDFVASLVE